MTHDLILANIAKHITLGNDEILYFISVLKQQHVTKKSFLLKEGQSCKNISFVHYGTLRAFHLNNEGKESTIMFAMENWWITDMHCFINEQPAMLNIVAVEDSGIFQLQKNDLDELYFKVPKFERFFRIILQNAYIREQLRTIQSLTLPAEERYDQFLVKYPQVAKNVTQKQIASYLGITPEFLSTIRGNKLRR